MATWKSWGIVAMLTTTACGLPPPSEDQKPDAAPAPADAAVTPADAMSTGDGGEDAAGPDVDANPREAAADVVPIVPPGAATFGATALTGIDALPFLLLDEQSRHASSYDRAGNNTDFGNAYGVDAAGNAIVLDARGPGCVYRIWFTDFAASDQIRVYFDDEATPRIEMPLTQLFTGESAPFTAPLVGGPLVSSGGFFSYVPLPFAKSIRITVTPDTRLYYNIDFHTLAADAVVPTWTGAEDLSAARSMWAAAGTDPKASAPGADAGSTVGVPTFDLGPMTTQTVYDADGPGELTAIELQIPGLSPNALDGGADSSAPAPATLGPMADVLNQLWVSMSWDNEATPSVLATVGSLFALGDLGAGKSRGLLAGMRPDGTLYLYFPMPFSRHAQIAVRNRGTAAVNGLQARVTRRPFAYPFVDVGTFAVEYHVVTSNPGADLALLDTAGSGKVVGVVLSESRAACANCVERDYLEGNERVLVDGARTPVVLGTGTEDFFNGGFYFYEGPFGLPTHGNVVHAATLAYDATSAYRFFVSDPISFRNQVRLSLQHGPLDNDAVVASSLVYYYRQARLRLMLTDALLVGDAVSERQHTYEIANQTWSGTLNGTWDGEFSLQPLTATGRSHKGSSSFNLQVDPANRGVILRRLLNQGVGNQRGQVFVNGTSVGDWLTPGSNLTHAWREEDFALPASSTAGKSSLLIEIRFVSSDASWTEFQYGAYSELP